MAEPTSNLIVVEDPDECIMIVRDDEDGDGPIVARMEIYSSDDPDFDDAVQLANASLFAASKRMKSLLENFVRHYGSLDLSVEARKLLAEIGGQG